MKFLTRDACGVWCGQHGYRLRDYGLGVLYPDLLDRRYGTVSYLLPSDSGRKVALAKQILDRLEAPPEMLLWLREWEVFPSCGHVPVIVRFREACGTTAPLDETPGHVAAWEERDDALSILVMSLEFCWDCFVLSSEGDTIIFVSHDEFIQVLTRSSKREEVFKELAELFALSPRHGHLSARGGSTGGD